MAADETFVFDFLSELAGNALRWWLGELACLVPGRLRRLTHRPRMNIFIDLFDEIGLVRTDEAGNTVAIGRISADHSMTIAPPPTIAASLKALPKGDWEVLLRIRPDLVLRRTVRLPVAARRRLRPILAHEIGRRTPLDAAQVLFDHRVRDRDRKTGQIEVELILIKREAAERAAQVAQWLGLQPAAITIAGDSTVERYHLLPGGPGQAEASRRLSLTLALAAAALATASLLAAGWQDDRVTALLDAEAGRARSEIQQLDGLRRDLAVATQRLDYLAQRRKQPSAATVLAEVTRLLPDGTWIFEFELVGTEVHVRGYSPAASTLISIFDGSDQFANTHFKAPLTQGPGNGLERFDLSFEIRGGRP